MIRRPPRSTPTDTLFPYTTLFRSHFRVEVEAAGGEAARTDDLEHRERHFLDRIGELIGVPAILVIAAVGVDRPENAEGGGGGDLMLEGMARQRRMIGLDIDAHLVLEPVALEEEIGRASCRERVCKYV